MNKEYHKDTQQLDVVGVVWKNTKPGVEVTAALVTPIAKSLAEIGLIFVGHELSKNRTYRKVMSHLL